MNDTMTELERLAEEVKTWKKAHDVALYNAQNAFDDFYGHMEGDRVECESKGLDYDTQPTSPFLSKLESRMLAAYRVLDGAVDGWKKASRDFMEYGVQHG